MRKKLISLFTALIVFTGYSLPAFAEEIAVDSVAEAEQIITETSDDSEIEETVSTDTDDEAITENAESVEEAADESEEEETTAGISDETAETETPADTDSTDEENDDDTNDADIAETAEPDDAEEPGDNGQSETPEAVNEDTAEDNNIAEMADITEPNETEDTADTADTEETADAAAEDEELLEEEQELYAGDWYEWNASTGTLTLKGQLPDTNYDYDNSISNSLARQAGINRDLVKTVIIKPNTKAGSSLAFAFGGAKNLSSINGLANLDTSTVTDMMGMFGDCKSLTNLNLSGLSTDNVTDMSIMFYCCSSLTSLNLSSFNTSNVTDMEGMFEGCQALTMLNISNFDTRNVVNMNSMFGGCNSLSSLNVSSFNTTNVTDMGGMFDGCQALTTLNISNFDTRNVVIMDWMFGGCNSLSSLNVSNFNTGKVTDMTGMFNGCRSLTSLDVSCFDTSSVESMKYMFTGCSSLRTLNVSNFETYNVMTMYAMFGACPNLISLDLSSFRTDNVTDMAGMFDGCSALQEIKMSGFNTNKVTTMEGMFANCTSLKRLDLTGFGTGSVQDMTDMFFKCTSLTSLDLSSFDTGSVQSMEQMFCYCDRLTKVTVSDRWVTSSVTISDGMFYGCTNLRGGNGTSFNSNYDDKTYARIDKAGQKGYLTGAATAVTVPKPTFTLTAGNGSAAVKWNAVSGATSYRVYRVENGSFIFRTETTSLSYTDTGLTNGRQYGYLVRAFKGSTGSSYTNSDIKYVTPVFSLSKPTFTVTAGNASAAVKWNAVSGATSYRVYRVDNGSYIYRTETTSLSYTDTGLTNGKKYGYLVRAFKGSAGSSYTASDVKYITPAVSVTKPTFTVTAGNNSAVISWSKVSGATSYRIYRVDNGKYTPLANSTGTSYTATGLTNGTKYGFLVRAFKDSTGSAYTASDIKYVTPVFTLAKPVFTVTALNNSATIKWNAVSGATSYRVYRVENGSYIYRTETTSLSYTDTGLTNGKQYGYLVRAFNGSTGSSYTASDVKYVTPVFTLAKPTFTVTAGNNSAVITWNKVSGATQYRIYRVDNGKYTALTNSTGTSYTATGLTKGTKYGFLIRAFNGTTGSPYTSNDVVYVIAN